MCMSDNKYLLPGYYKEGTEANTLLGAFENTVDLLKKYIFSAFSQTSAGTATWALDDWEKELGITPGMNATDDLRRAVIKAKLMRPPTMTPAQIKAIANCFVPAKDADIVDPVAPYTFRIVLPSTVPWIAEMIQQINEAKPAHLAMEVQMRRKDVLEKLCYGLLNAQVGRKKIYLPTVPAASTSAKTGIAYIRAGRQSIGSAQPEEMAGKLYVGAMIRRTGRITIGGIR